MERDFLPHGSSAASMPSNEGGGPNMRPTPGPRPPPGPSSTPPTSNPSLHHSLAAAGCVGGRILSRNANGTIAMTSQPTNESELQLYRVLQRANLLSYYDTFICQGGDDVQQLCEAGEEEFLEIMALVGMASKPLHVRRLQKALQEWVSNPAMFQSPLVPSFNPGPPPGHPHPPPLPGPPPQSMREQYRGEMVNRPSPINLSSQTSPVAMRHSPPSSMALPASTSGLSSSHSTPSPTNPTKEHVLSPTNSSAPGNMALALTMSPAQVAQHMSGSHHQSASCGLSGNGNGNGNGNGSGNGSGTGNGNGNGNGLGLGLGTGSSSGMALITNEYGQPASPISLTPVLVESQIQRLSESAEMLVKSLPPMDPKLANNKKRISKELEYVMNMPEDDSRRMDEIRKYAAIYGRFDCKRKPEKPLTLHEVSVNEAAAQICRHIPALLTRRDELFPLARQVVRDSGYQYSKGHSRSQCYARPFDATGMGSNSMDSMADQSNPLQPATKRIRTSEPGLSSEAKIQFNEEERKRRQERLESIVDLLKGLGSQQETLKQRLQQAHDDQNFGAVNELQSELDQISTHQMQLINEQSEVNKQLRRLEKYQGLSRAYRIPSGSVDDKIDTDDTDSQFSLYSNTSSPSLSQDPRGESPTDRGGDSSHHSNSSDHFSKLLPAKKSGNTAAATQLTRQLVQETLLDEGLRVVKEFNNQINEEGTGTGIDLRITSCKASEALSTCPPTASSSIASSSSAPPPYGMTSSSMASSMASIVSMAHHHTPRPRGRPPKFHSQEREYPFQSGLSAAYHSQLSHHIHQTLLANQVFNAHHSGALPANCFANINLAAAAAAAETTNGLNSQTNGLFMQDASKGNQSTAHSNDLTNNNDLNMNNNNISLKNSYNTDCGSNSSNNHGNNIGSSSNENTKIANSLLESLGKDANDPFGMCFGGNANAGEEEIKDESLSPSQMQAKI